MCFCLSLFTLPFKSNIQLENAILRHQLIVLQRKIRGRARFTDGNRLLFIWLYRWFPPIFVPSVTFESLCVFIIVRLARRGTGGRLPSNKAREADEFVDQLMVAVTPLYANFRARQSAIA